MYIILTNSAPAHKGQKLSINSELVATIHTSPVLRESGGIEDVTFVFCPPHGTWEVSESLETVVRVLNTFTQNNK